MGSDTRVKGAAIAVAGMAALLLPLGANDYLLHITIISIYYAVLASSWALLAGYAGQVSFAHMAFAALGGYTSALLVTQTGLPIPAGMVAGFLLSGVAGALIGFLCLPLGGPYLALFTLAFSVIFQLVLIAEYQLTRGSLGLEVPAFFGGRAGPAYYYFAIGLLAACLIAMNLLIRSRLGLFLRAIREDQEAAEACGVDTAGCRIIAFTLTSAIAGLAGAFYGHYVGILTPNLVNIPEMGLVVAMAVVGGIESLTGAVIGAIVVYVASEELREVGQLRFLLLGAAIILTQRFAQNGLIAPLVFRAARAAQRRPADSEGAAPMAEVGTILPKPAPHSIEAEALAKRFGGVAAVNGVSFRIQRGELIGLIGPNGSGKTTLINLVTGALQPDDGRIRIDGRDMKGRRPHQFARAGVGRTFQVPRLFQRMTVRENLMVPALVGSHRAGDVRRRVDEVLAFLSLGDLTDARARALSGGQRKLLEFGRSLMLEPTILCLDEPFAGVHPRLLDQILDHITVLNRRGYTLIIVDHNLDAVRHVAERRLMVMARGELIADGPPQEVLANPAVVSAYIGT